VRLRGVFSGSGFRDARNPTLFPEPDMGTKVDLYIYAPDDERFSPFNHGDSENTVPIRIVVGET
jgi:hypothetical protein